MKLLKPHWVHHDEKPIFSVDIHPDGSKFATGGNGNENGRVCIWNLDPLLSEEAEADERIPKMLCQLDNHLACVNCVRWSRNGQMLASAGDDKIIIIWKRGKGAGSVFGSTVVTKMTENWRCMAQLRGHSGDVLDLAWSPQDQWLASCSVDNNVIIWDANDFPTIVKILKGHSGLVKGVSWDPVGKFIASQSDDKSVRIWKTSDWSCQSTITEPFDECGGTTHVLRLSWSPDGLYLVSAHSMNGGGPTAQIIERDIWKLDKDFVGHRKAVTCVRYYNSILKRQHKSTNKIQQYCCLAIGSRDHSLSVWMTVLKRPLVVIHNLFEGSVLDLSWSTEKNILLACSVDGTVACLLFRDDELGTPLSEEDKTSLYRKMYGKQSDKDVIVEYAEVLNNEKPRPASPINNAATAVVSVKNNNNHNNNNQNNNNQNNNNNNNHNNNNQNNNNNDVEMQLVAPQSAKPVHKQVEMRTVDGKRRITPLHIPVQEEEIIPAVSTSGVSRTVNDIFDKTNSNEPQITTGLSTPPAVPSPSLTSQLDNRLVIKQLPAPIKSNKIGTVEPQIDMDTNTVGTSSDTKELRMISSAIPRTGKATSLKGPYTKLTTDYRIQILNGCINTTYGQLAKVMCFPISNANNKNIQLWQIFVGSPIVNFCVCRKYAIICCLNGTLQFLNIKNGSLVMPIIKLPSAAVECACSINSELGGIVSECGIVRIWNINEQCIFITTNCTDMLNGSHVVQFYITEKGIALILLANGSAFSFCKKLQSWLILNSNDPLTRYSLSTSTFNINKNVRLFPLSSVQSSSFNKSEKSNNCTNLSEGVWQHTAKLSFIENQIQICQSINSPVELEHWYSMLGAHLAMHGTEQRIRILLDDLLGPIHSSSADSNRSNINDADDDDDDADGDDNDSRSNRQNNEILGIKKHRLLDNVLEYFKDQPQWQRIFMEYSGQTIQLKCKKRKLNGDTH